MTTLQQQLKAFERRQLIGSLALLMMLLLASGVLNFILIQRQAEQVTKLVSRMSQTKDFREIVLTLQEARLQHFRKVEFRSADPRKSFTLPEVESLRERQSMLHDFAFQYLEFPIDSIDQAAGSESIVYEFNNFALVPHAFAVWATLVLFAFLPTRAIKKKIEIQYDKDVKLNEELAYVEIAKKVRHNVRTPLAALMRVSDNIRKAEPRQNDILNGIVSQIEDLIRDLEPATSAARSTPTEHSFYRTVLQAIAESQLTMPTRVHLSAKIDDSIASARVSFVAHELKSIVANLINNATEAIDASGNIQILVLDQINYVLIEVIDTGRGIPKDHLDKVTKNGFTFGKPKGTGIGLYHAMSFIEQWNGKLKIQSASGATKVSLSLPLLGRAPWYTPRIKLPAESTVVVIDEQAATHTLWTKRFRDLGFKGEIASYNNFEEAKALFSDPTVKFRDLHIFVDFDLREEALEDGVVFLNNISQTKNKYLVTDHFREAAIQDICIESQLTLIPKTELSVIPIVIVPTAQT